jgi:4-amino-4-deoxy-L-arabinose transferase-like glycosyltransferase
MPSEAAPKRPLTTTLALAALWIVFYASFTLFRPALLDDADSVHAEVAREMLLRHDWITLYADGIRYLEKAPLLYWSMAASMRVSQLLGHPSASCLAVAARIPLALTILALAFAVEAFARRAFRSARAGLYAALILLSSPGIFLFTRITLPDAMVCLWLTLAMLCFWLTEQIDQTRNGIDQPLDRVAHPFQSHRKGWVAFLDRGTNASVNHRLLCCAFAACCALNVLTKGLIGVVFPIAIVTLYLLLTRGPRGTIHRILELHPFSCLAVFLAIAAPWHILIAWANLSRGNPGELTFTHGHFSVPLPTQGNVHGWLWFYFVNEQVLRYLNLRVPRDYDTVPLWLFWGLCLVWLMPWSAFIFHAFRWRNPLSHALLNTPARRTKAWQLYRRCGLPRELHAPLLLIVWTAIVLLFFSLSTRQEYYVLPALPAITVLIGGWLAQDVAWQPITDKAKRIRRANLRATVVLLALGTIFAAAVLYFLLHARTPSSTTDLAALLQQNPGDYAMSMGHFLDLNTQALGLFRLPLAIAAASLFLGPLASYILRKRASFENSTKCPHAATLALAAGAFGFLLAAHLGLQTFAPALSSQQLAAAIAPQVHADDLIVIHQEYEFASTLGFYLQRPGYSFYTPPAIPGGIAHPIRWPRAVNPIHILTDAEYNGVANYGRSSNLWYGSFFPDAPAIFEIPQTLAQKWLGPQRIFLWQDLTNQPSPLPASLSPVYVIARSGGKEIVSNQPAALP